MGRKRRDDVTTFAEVVSQLPENSGSGQSVPVVNLAQLDEFTDADGVRWRRRGGHFEGKALHRLLTDPFVRVLHDYMGETEEVPSGERERFWGRAQELMAKSRYSSFYGADFKNERCEHLLVVHEDC